MCMVELWPGCHVDAWAVKSITYEIIEGVSCYVALVKADDKLKEYCIKTDDDHYQGLAHTKKMTKRVNIVRETWLEKGYKPFVGEQSKVDNTVRRLVLTRESTQ